jgi:hypothetical protein
MESGRSAVEVGSISASMWGIDVGYQVSRKWILDTGNEFQIRNKK